MPITPFSLCRMTSRSAGRWLATLVGKPMPRLTTAPSGMSTATRAAISSRVQAGVVLVSLMTLSLILFEACRTGGGAWHFHNVLDEQARCNDRFRGDLAQLNDFVNRRNGALGGRGHDRTKVASGFAVRKVAPAVARFGLDQRKVGKDRVFEHVVAPVDLANFLAFGQFGAVAGGREEGTDTSAGGADSFGKVALRNQFEFNLAAAVQLVEHV